MSRQDFGHFEAENGQTLGFQSIHRGDSQLQRIKERGVVSHFLAQRSALLDWLSRPSLRHAVVVRIYDDTNVWTVPQKRTQEAEPEMDDHAGGHAAGAGADNRKSSVGRLGKRKVSPLMGMIQRVFVRSQADGCLHDRLQYAQIHAPAQILPKAYHFVIRVCTWFVLY